MQGVHLYTLMDIKNMSAYTQIYNSFSVAPSVTVSGYYETMVDALQFIGSWNKCDIFQFYSAHNQADSLINWKEPGINDPAAIDNPTWSQYQGFTSTLGPPKGYVNTNYKPSEDATYYLLNSATLIVGTGNSVVDTSEVGAMTGTGNETRINGWASGTGVRASLNSNYIIIPNTIGSGKGHFGVTRNNSTQFTIWQNITPSVQSRTSVAVTGRDFWATTANQNDVSVEVTLKQVRYVWAGGYLTNEEYIATVNAIEACLDSLGTGLK